MGALRTFGGIMPSVEPRGLPADAAQAAENLDMRFGDFRPSRGLGASITVVAAGAKSVFRTPNTGAWLSSSTDTDYVLGQLQDNPVERVYLTGHAAYPEAWEAGVYRPLGIAAPLLAPTVSVQVVDEFSTNELTTGRTVIPAKVAEIFTAALTPVGLGSPPSDPPTTLLPGWLMHGSQPGLPTRSTLQQAFCVPMVLSGADYVMRFPDAHNFLLMPELGGLRVTFGGNQYWAVALYVKGQGQTINEAAAVAGLKTVMNPANTAVRLWDDARIDEIVAARVAVYSQTTEPAKGLIDGINSSLVGLAKVFESISTLTDLRAAMKAFFLRTEVVNEIAGLVGSPALDAGLSGTLSGSVTQEAAGSAYQFGHYTAGMGESNVTASRYFNPGADATSAANIRADINSCITEDTRGVKVFDRPKLRKILSDEFMIIIAKRTGGDAWTQAGTTSKIEQCLTIIDRVFVDSHWAANPNWPNGQGIDKHNASAAIAARESVRAACDLVGLHFDQLKRETLSYINGRMYDEFILAELPDPIDRIEESRCYRFTYITDRGEESAMSPPSVLIDCDRNDIVTVVVGIPPAGKFIRRVRLYRSSTSSTATAFEFTVENEVEVSDAQWVNAINRTYIDNLRQEDLGEPCPSETWDPPPAGGNGLIGMPNGIMLMFEGVNVIPSEPYTPYAYPIDYQQPMDYAYVGAGVFGNTAVIVTTGNPYYCTGADSASLTLQKIESNQACVSKRSVHGGDGGVFFASPDGICLAGPSGVQVLTTGVYSRQDWLALDPANSIGRYHEGIYYLVLLSSNIVICMDLASRRISTLSLTTTGLYSDLSTDSLYAVVGTELRPMFAGSLLTGRWKSKIMPAAGFWGLSAAKIESDFDAPIVMKLYGDGVLYHTATFSTRVPQRLPAKRSRDLEIEFTSTGRFTVAFIGPTMGDLQ